MKKNFRFLAMAVVAMAAAVFTGWRLESNTFFKGISALKL